MKKSCLYILIFLLFSIKLIGQNVKLIRIQQIDSLVSLIPENVSDNEYYSFVQSNEILYKKVFNLFKKQIGEISSFVVYHDTLLYSISNIYHLEKGNRIKKHIFYYENNELVKFLLEQTINIENDNNEELEHKIIAYYDNFDVLKFIATINDNFVFDKNAQDTYASMGDIEHYVQLELIKSSMKIEDIEDSNK